MEWRTTRGTVSPEGRPGYRTVRPRVESLETGWTQGTWILEEMVGMGTEDGTDGKTVRNLESNLQWRSLSEKTLE